MSDRRKPGYKHCEYQSFEYLQVDPLAQHVGPVHPIPPHWPYSAEQLPADVIAACDVLVVVVDVFSVVLLVVVEPVELPPVNLTVTTPCAGTLTVTAPPDSVAPVLAAFCPLLVTHACAAPGANPEKATLGLCADDPELVSTTTMLPSVFCAANASTPDIDPDSVSRRAPGRIQRLHMTNAQQTPDVITSDPDVSSR